MNMNTKIQTQTTIRPAALLLCAAMTVGGLQATARAAIDDGVKKETVSYADLDLSKPAGAKTLYGRIASAAHRVCADSYRDLAMTRWVNTCTDKAIDEAVRKVNSPELSALRPTSVIHLASN
jgi:UrcA family protein